jgi:hypothetical protein
MGQHEAGAVARQYLVHRETVDDGDALVLSEYLATFIGRFPGRKR